MHLNKCFLQFSFHLAHEKFNAPKRVSKIQSATTHMTQQLRGTQHHAYNNYALPEPLRHPRWTITLISINKRKFTFAILQILNTGQD